MTNAVLNETGIENESMRLMAMSNDQFRSVCEEDIKAGQKPKPGEEPFRMEPVTAHALRRPPVIQRFYSQLSQLQKNIEGQLAAKKADLDGTLARMRLHGDRHQPAYEEAIIKHTSWRGSALRFKSGVENRRVELQGILRAIDVEFFADRVKEERNQALVRVSQLEEAIQSHRDHECGATCNDEVCIEDHRLWTMIEE